VTASFFVALSLGAGQLSAKDELNAKPEKWPSLALGLVGFNYTDQEISDFDVDGVGGDGLSVSTKSSGGGGTLCCIGWRNNMPLPQTFHVRWAADLCEFTTEPNMYGNTFESHHHFYKEMDVKFWGPVPKDPSYFETHFYPDGHIEVAVTSGPLMPRLKLDPARQRPIRRCTAEELKQ